MHDVLATSSPSRTPTTCRSRITWPCCYDREVLHRENRRLDRLLRTAKLRVTACVEDINYRHPRGLERGRMAPLTSGAEDDRAVAPRPDGGDRGPGRLGLDADYQPAAHRAPARLYRRRDGGRCHSGPAAAQRYRLTLRGESMRKNAARKRQQLTHRDRSAYKTRASERAVSRSITIAGMSGRS